MSRFLQALGLRRKHLDAAVFKLPLRFLARHGMMGEWLLRGVPIDEPVKLRLSPTETFSYWVHPDEGIGHMLYWYGFRSWENQSVRLFARLARRARTVLDIGANTGVYTLVSCAVNPRVHVISFEPVPRTRQRFLRNLALNGFEARCQVRPEALSDHGGSACFEVPEDATMARFSDGPAGTGLEVVVTTADEVLDQQEPVDLVKIDVEGFEDKVLLGMRETLHRTRPAILFECLPGGPAEAIESLLRPLGYSFHRLAPGGPVPIPRLDPAAAVERNFLAQVC